MDKGLSRRNFLKALGAGTVATAAVIAGCKQHGTAPTEGSAISAAPIDKMTHRVNHRAGNDDYIECTECRHCMPCRYGVNIPGVFLHHNRTVRDGNRPRSSNDANYNEARMAFLVGYDRSIPKPQQADHCIGCELCKPHCSQAIDIPAEMRRIDSYTEQLKQQIDI